MKKKVTSSINFFLLVKILLILLVITVSAMSVEARKNHGKKKNKVHNEQHKKRKNLQRGNPTSTTPVRPDIPPPYYAPYPNTSTIFYVLSFGAKGNGVSDDSKALLAAWEGACKVPGATIEFPSDFKFLLQPTTLQGPCAPGLILQIDGIILAPPKVWSGPKSSMFQWINLKWLHDFTIQGSGTVDGQGSHWWTTPSRSAQFDSIKALRFYGSYNVTVRDIKIINSPNCHLKFDNSGGVKVHNLTISAPANSTNTDGIHLQNSQDVEIHHSNIGCGDDCVSIQTGCTNIHVHHINCGPGHGISLGGLGKGGTVACVTNIVVENVSMNNTLYGARIKTWQGGLGVVKNVSFSKIQVSNVKVPVMIDQFYCDKHVCKNQTGGVAIAGVKFDEITGTYTTQPLHLACSDSVPCSDVKLSAIHLQPSPGFRGIFRQLPPPPTAMCWNSFGMSQPPLVPPTIDYCLRKGSSSLLRKIARSHDKNC